MNNDLGRDVNEAVFISFTQQETEFAGTNPTIILST